MDWCWRSCDVPPSVPPYPLPKSAPALPCLPRFVVVPPTLELDSATPQLDLARGSPALVRLELVQLACAVLMCSEMGSSPEGRPCGSIPEPSSPVNSP
eukprot:1063066-Pelagomonas_calceolata.AAC.11